METIIENDKTYMIFFVTYLWWYENCCL